MVSAPSTRAGLACRLATWRALRAASRTAQARGLLTRPFGAGSGTRLGRTRTGQGKVRIRLRRRGEAEARSNRKSFVFLSLIVLCLARPGFSQADDRPV